MSANARVVMVRPSLPETPLPVAAPDGIAVRLQRADEAPCWTAVQRAAEPFFAIADSLFAREYGHDPESVARRCYLAFDRQSGQPVGACGAWYGEGARADWGRIHWVAVRPDYQRRGIARALVATSMNRLRALGHTQAYLVTSTGRLGAIRLYRDFGFVPDFTADGAEDAWAQVEAAGLTFP